MYLMGHDETVFGDVEQTAQCFAVLADIIVVVATIAVDVECRVAALAAASVARTAEGSDTCPHVVEVELRLLHDHCRVVL